MAGVVERHRLAEAEWVDVGNGTYLAAVHQTAPLTGTMFLRYDAGGRSPNHSIRAARSCS